MLINIPPAGGLVATLSNGGNPFYTSWFWPSICPEHCPRTAVLPWTSLRFVTWTLALPWTNSITNPILVIWIA